MITTLCPHCGEPAEMEHLDRMVFECGTSVKKANSVRKGSQPLGRTAKCLASELQMVKRLNEILRSELKRAMIEIDDQVDIVVRLGAEVDHLHGRIQKMEAEANED